VKVRYPHTGAFLPAKGAWVPWVSYWIRRLADDSVIECEPPSTATKKAAKKTVTKSED